MELLGERLKKLRTVKSFTQRRISMAMNVTLRAYQRYENNEQKPSYDKLVNILNEFKDINSIWLLTGEGEMFISDRSEKVINSGMPPEFIEKLRDDIKNKDDSFFASLSMSKDKLFDVLIGKQKLSRVEVIELARKLNRSLDEYIYLSGYMPKEFEKIASNKKAVSLFRSMGQLTEKEIDQIMDVLAKSIKLHFDKKNFDKKKKNGEDSDLY